MITSSRGYCDPEFVIVMIMGLQGVEYEYGLLLRLGS